MATWLPAFDENSIASPHYHDCMPAEVSLQTFIDLALKSRLLDQGQIDRAIASRTRPGAKPPPPPGTRDLADLLVRTGDLTHYQAAKLLHGRWAGLALGPYRILAPLGRGGMGTVYLARDTRLAEELGDEVLVALKILPPGSRGSRSVCCCGSSARSTWASGSSIPT